ncbi:MAG: hypothetical protein WAX59_04960, partial [Lactococcus raffinolactis]
MLPFTSTLASELSTSSAHNIIEEKLAVKTTISTLSNSSRFFFIALGLWVKWFTIFIKCFKFQFDLIIEHM